jgi:hypothetical protein
MSSKFIKRRCEIIDLNNNLYDKKDVLRAKEHAFFKTFISMLTSTLTTSFIINFIKTMFDLRLINIIENRKRKQETKIRKRERKRQIEFNFKQKRIKNCRRKRQATNSINKKYFRNRFRAYICLFNANNNLLVALLSNFVRILFDKFVIMNFVD